MSNFIINIDQIKDIDKDENVLIGAGTRNEFTDTMPTFQFYPQTVSDAITSLECVCVNSSGIEVDTIALDTAYIEYVSAKGLYRSIGSTINETVTVGNYYLIISNGTDSWQSQLFTFELTSEIIDDAAMINTYDQLMYNTYGQTMFNTYK